MPVVTPPREPNPELTRAIRAGFDELDVSQEHFGALVASQEGRVDAYTQSTVSAWLNGRHRPEPRQLFAIEAVLRLAPGTLSRLDGYLPVGAAPVTSVPDAIEADPSLTPTARRYLIASWEAVREVAAAAPRSRSRR